MKSLIIRRVGVCCLLVLSNQVYAYSVKDAAFYSLLPMIAIGALDIAIKSHTAGGLRAGLAVTVYKKSWILNLLVYGSIFWIFVYLLGKRIAEVRNKALDLCVTAANKARLMLQSSEKTLFFKLDLAVLAVLAKEELENSGKLLEKLSLQLTKAFEAFLEQVYLEVKESMPALIAQQKEIEETLSAQATNQASKELIKANMQIMTAESLEKILKAANIGEQITAALSKALAETELHQPVAKALEACVARLVQESLERVRIVALDQVTKWKVKAALKALGQNTLKIKATYGAKIATLNIYTEATNLKHAVLEEKNRISEKIKEQYSWISQTRHEEAIDIDQQARDIGQQRCDAREHAINAWYKEHDIIRAEYSIIIHGNYNNLTPEEIVKMIADNDEQKLKIREAVDADIKQNRAARDKWISQISIETDTCILQTREKIDIWILMIRAMGNAQQEYKASNYNRSMENIYNDAIKQERDALKTWDDAMTQLINFYQAPS